MCISRWLFNVHIEILTNSFVCRSQWMYNHGHSDGDWDRTLQTSPQISFTEFFFVYMYQVNILVPWNKCMCIYLKTGNLLNLLDWDLKPFSVVKKMKSWLTIIALKLMCKVVLYKVLVHLNHEVFKFLSFFF